MSGEVGERLLRLQASINEKYDRIEELGGQRNLIASTLALTTY